MADVQHALVDVAFKLESLKVRPPPCGWQLKSVGRPATAFET